MQELGAAGADAAALTTWGGTPLFYASLNTRTDVIAFLIQVPAVQASVDTISQGSGTALSCASCYGRQPIVQLLLDDGADPTLPPGPHAPIRIALSREHHDVAALLHHAIAEPDRVRRRLAAVGKSGGLGEDLCVEVSKYLLPAWATREPHARDIGAR